MSIGSNPRPIIERPESPRGKFISKQQTNDRNRSLSVLGLDIINMDFEQFYWLEEFRDWDESFMRIRNAVI